MTRPPSHRVVGITLVRDERDVIASSIRSLIAQHVDEILVVDNGSEDGTSRILRRLSKHCLCVSSGTRGPTTSPPS